MDDAEFAQTRPPDDLFDDEVVPIPSLEIKEQQQQPSTHFASTEPPSASAASSFEHDHTASVGRYATSGPNRGGYSRGASSRGGRGGDFRYGYKDPVVAPQGEEGVTLKSNEQQEGEVETGDVANPGNNTEGSIDREGNVKVFEGGRTAAVRGDRSGTGGVKVKKLTEDELSARLASIKLKNAALEAAHRRAEADEASFQKREQQAAFKRQEERANRREMEGERERNRLRKMKASQGREWDMEKNEEDFKSGSEYRGRGGYRRGVHGAVVVNDENPRNGRSEDGSGGGYGALSPRGNRGRRGGRRGDGDGGENGMSIRGRGGGRERGGGGHRVPNTSAQDEFPALPSMKKMEKEVPKFDTSKRDDPAERLIREKENQDREETQGNKIPEGASLLTKSGSPRDGDGNKQDQSTEISKSHMPEKEEAETNNPSPNEEPVKGEGEGGTWAEQVEAG